MRFGSTLVVGFLCVGCGGEAGTAPPVAPSAQAKIELPSITPTRASVLTVAEVGAALGATFTKSDERADPPGGYSVISGCRYQEQAKDPLQARQVWLTITSHGGEAESARQLADDLDMVKTSGVSFAPVPELGPDALWRSRSRVGVGEALSFRRGKDCFELVLSAGSAMPKEARLGALKALAAAVLAL